MDALPQFTLPFSGMGDGVHEFDFQANAKFFAAFEASPISEGNVNIHLIFDKKPDLMLATYEISGTIHTICDRCLEPFNLPIEDVSSLIFKLVDEESDDPDVVHLPKGSKSLNVAEYIYEFIVLAIPMIKTHELADEDCDEEMMRYLEEPETEEANEEENTENPIWGALKDIKLN